MIVSLKARLRVELNGRIMPEHKFNLWTSYLIQRGVLRGLQASAGVTVVTE